MTSCARVDHAHNVDIAWEENGDARIELDYRDYVRDHNYLTLKKIPRLDLWCGQTEVTFYQLQCYGYWDNYHWADEFGFSNAWPGFNITLSTAQNYCKWLNEKTKEQRPQGYTFRLPTVKEWESIAKCGDNRIYPWKDEKLELMADGKMPNLYTRRPVSVWDSGRNEEGIYGLSGNVEEWCFDKSSQSYGLKGGYSTTCNPTRSSIAYMETIKSKQWPFFPLLKDRPSHYGCGFRVILAKGKAEE